MQDTARATEHTGIRLPSLTSLRWFAATIVFIRHGGALLQGTSLESAYRNVGPQGASGVSFFFILSGFVLAWTYRPESPTAFYRRRFARIVPAYLVAIAVGLAYIVVFQHTQGLAYVLQAVFPATLLQSWVPDPAIYFGNSAVSWSLSTEVFFYAIFPLIIAPVMRLSKRGLMKLMLGAAIVSIATPLVLHPQKGGGLAFWAIYINPTYRLMEFVIGLCLAGLLIRGVRAKIPITTAAALALSLIHI